jgi:hypothetical protein
MINERQASIGISKISEVAVNHFWRTRFREEIACQQRHFDDFPLKGGHDHLNKEQQAAKLAGKPFEPDNKKAEEYAKHSLEFGVGQRLRGAYACYKADMQLECIRHILLALGSVCNVIGWDQASVYINQQNNILLDMKKAEEEAA